MEASIQALLRMKGVCPMPMRVQAEVSHGGAVTSDAENEQERNFSVLEMFLTTR